MVFCSFSTAYFCDQEINTPWLPVSDHDLDHGTGNKFVSFFVLASHLEVSSPNNHRLGLFTFHTRRKSCSQKHPLCAWRYFPYFIVRKVSAIPHFSMKKCSLIAKKKERNWLLIDKQLFACSKNDKTQPSKEEVLLLGAKRRFTCRTLAKDLWKGQ